MMAYTTKADITSDEYSSAVDDCREITRIWLDTHVTMERHMIRIQPSVPTVWSVLQVIVLTHNRDRVCGDIEHISVHSRCRSCHSLRGGLGGLRWCPNIPILPGLLLQIKSKYKPLKDTAQAEQGSILRNTFNLKPSHLHPLPTFHSKLSFTSRPSSSPTILHAAFILTCIPLFSTHDLGSLRAASNFSTLALLQLLERDMPDHIACPHCLQFHAIDDAQRHLPEQRFYLDRRYWHPERYTVPECWKVHIECLSSDNISPNFNWVIFHMAMKRHRQGAKEACIELLGLLCLDKPSYEGQPVDAVDCRVVNGSLLVRKQIILRGSDVSEARPSWLTSLRIYCHLGDLGWQIGECKVVTAQRLLGWQRRGYISDGQWSSLTQCHWCPTEFRVDFDTFSTDSDAMVLTAWKDVGDGSSPQEEKWLSHVPRAIFTGHHRWEKYQFVPGSICATFEDFIGTKSRFLSLSCCVSLGVRFKSYFLYIIKRDTLPWFVQISLGGKCYLATRNEKIPCALHCLW